MKDERESKLPKWARDELDSLRRRLDEVKDQNAILRNELPSRIYSQEWAETETKRFLNDRAPIYFETDHGRLHAYIRDGVLQISGYGPVNIEPSASNTFYVKECK